jgi:hypothetical protein
MALPIFGIFKQKEGINVKKTYGKKLLGALAVGTLAFAAVTSQAATVSLDGTTAIGITNLLLPVRTPAGDFFYDVTFEFGDAFSIYGDDLDFEFPGEDEAEFAMIEIFDALDNSPATTVGVSSLDNSGSFFIGYEFDGTFVITVSANYNDLSERWQQPSRSEPLLPTEPRWFATFEPTNPVPVPAAAWLFGSALLGLGVIKRKKA